MSESSGNSCASRGFSPFPTTTVSSSTEDWCSKEMNPRGYFTRSSVSPSSSVELSCFCSDDELPLPPHSPIRDEQVSWMKPNEPWEGSQSDVDNRSDYSPRSCSPDAGFELVATGRKRLRTNQERLAAVKMAEEVGLYQAAIVFNASHSSIKVWTKCKTLIAEMDPSDTHFYALSHKVPEVIKDSLVNYLEERESEWPLDIKLVRKQLRVIAKSEGFPEYAAVPGVDAFLKSLKMEFQLTGAFRIGNRVASRIRMASE